jgi:CRISPR-associated protein Cmx8
MDYLYHFAKRRVKEEEIAYSISAVELYHVEKRGNSVHQLAAVRILPPGKDVLADYELFRKTARNPLYKSIRIRNLLDDKPWYAGSDYIFSRFPAPFFTHIRGESPLEIPLFAMDVRRKFSAIEDNIKLLKGGGRMNDMDRDDQLARRVYRLIQSYVNRRTEEKSGFKYSDFKDDKDEEGRTRYPEKYRTEREKVCSDAFLAMRGRMDRDFIEYFTGTIGSVPQYLPEAEYLSVSHALMNDWEKVKILSMLALSAHSRL